MIKDSVKRRNEYEMLLIWNDIMLLDKSANIDILSFYLSFEMNSKMDNMLSLAEITSRMQETILG